MDTKKLIVGAASGLVSAVLVDLHAWQNTEGPYNWTKAAKRWVGGAVSGATAALGLTAAGV